MNPTSSSLTRKRPPMLIAGPCSAETPEQITASLIEAKKRGVDFVRISLWKPRTKPGFDGLKEAGIPLLAQAVEMGLNPATEVLTAEHAQVIVDAIVPLLGEARRLMLWIGARNQNHLVQQEIARVAAQDDRIMLMVKNQPWPSEDHFEGIAHHILSSGINPDNAILCHRGFTTGVANALNLRNTPDSEMAMRIREKTGLRMILDISHIAGCRSNIDVVSQELRHHAYDGLIIEVHPDPENAWTDAKQQITWDTLDRLLVDCGVSEQRKNQPAASIQALPLKEMALVC